MSKHGLLHFTPIYKSKVWGGTALADLFGRDLPAKDIGESWELSDRGADTNTAAKPDPIAGASFRQLIAGDPDYILGKRAHARWGKDKFPLLVKFIHAREDLSVQVHPPDPYAQKHEQEYGKAECWVILHVEKGARIQRGLKPGVTKKQFAEALRQGAVESLLHYFTPKPGDVLALPTGVVHAIGAGIVLAEIQQNSDVTYRVFDYNRPGLDGKPRPLHVEKALDVTGFDKYGDEFGDERDLRADTVTPQILRDTDYHGLIEERLATGSRFSLSRVYLQPGRHRQVRPPAKSKPAAYEVHETCEVWMLLKGSGEVGVNNLPGIPATAGQTFLVPGGEPSAWLLPKEPVTLLRAIPAG
ncbi:MAG TPA: type I phosphomannose isomerase catalytic subunit [Planctomycetota bacterium]|nr:type I phosphomannose isomerase catalytic subunit [Planctomycetota bacterium]